METEIGRELKVSQLRPRTVVVLERPDSVQATMWVFNVMPRSVIFFAGVTHAYFMARRVGPDMEQITDDTGRMLRIFEYLGEI